MSSSTLTFSITATSDGNVSGQFRFIPEAEDSPTDIETIAAALATLCQDLAAERDMGESEYFNEVITNAVLMLQDIEGESVPIEED